MSAPREFRDRSNDSLLTLLGEVPELIRNLVVAEVDAAKDWARKAGKDAGWGVAFFVMAIVFFIWLVPAMLAFVIAGLSSWWPVWLSALVVFAVMVVITMVFVLLGVMRFRALTRRRNPIHAVTEDIKEVRDEL